MGIQFNRSVPWLLAALSFILVVGMVRGKTSVFKYFELLESRDVLTKTIENLELDNQELRDELTRIKKSKSYATKILRDKYHLTEDGETIQFFAD